MHRQITGISFRIGVLSLKKLFLPLLITIWSLVFFSVAFAEEPLWPLSIEISQSSSFAEFRGMRFHAGIDLRTQQKNGLPVRAIADGFVSRASVQFRGYGYALYIAWQKNCCVTTASSLLTSAKTSLGTCHCSWIRFFLA